MRAVRHSALGGALPLLLLLTGLLARAGDPQAADAAASYKAQIVEVATRELRQSGGDPQRYRIRVLDRVDDMSRSFLAGRGIDPTGVWVVEFVPSSEGFGGGFEFFFRNPSTSIVLKTVEQ